MSIHLAAGYYIFTIRPALPVFHVHAIIVCVETALIPTVNWKINCIRKIECANHTQLVHMDSCILTAARKWVPKVVEWPKSWSELVYTMHSFSDVHVCLEERSTRTKVWVLGIVKSNECFPSHNDLKCDIINCS